MKTMNDVIAFVKKAMNLNLDIVLHSDNHIIKINNNDFCIFFYTSIGKLNINSQFGENISIEISEKEELQFNLLVEELREYLQERTIRDFDHFFDEYNLNNHINDINQLNDED